MTDKFKVGDLVTVVKQAPPGSVNYHIKTQGLSGYIEEINGDYAQFIELNEHGCGGMGAVLLSCLSLQNDNVSLQRLKKEKDDADAARQRQYMLRANAYTELLSKHLAKVSEETGVDPATIKKIFDAHDRFRHEWEDLS